MPWGRIRAWLLRPHTSTWSRLPALQFHVFFSPPAFFFLVWSFFPPSLSSSFIPPITQAATDPVVETRVSTNGCDLVVVLSSCCLQKHHWFPPQEKSNLDTKNGGAFFFQLRGETQWPRGCIHMSCGPFYQKLKSVLWSTLRLRLRFWLDLLKDLGINTGVVTPWHVFPRHNAALAHSLRSCDATLSRFVWTQSSDPIKSRRLNYQRLHPRLPLSFTSSTPPFDHDHCSFPHIVYQVWKVLTKRISKSQTL